MCPASHLGTGRQAQEHEKHSHRPPCARFREKCAVSAVCPALRSLGPLCRPLQVAPAAADQDARAW